MKALNNKLLKAEQRAIRGGAVREAKKLAKQAGKFRCDALAAGMKMSNLGGKCPYAKHHPVYEELIMPLLEEAANIAANAGFDILIQVRTPLEGAPDFTQAIGGFQDENKLTETMKGCVDLIKARPVLGGTPFGDVKSTPPEASE